MRENELVDELRELFRTDDPSVLTGSGPDDCAHVRSDGRRLSMTVDAFVEGSHFLPDAPAGDVARKALAASLSDLASSGCRARWVLVVLGMRPGLPEGWADEFARELAAAAREYGVAVVGGDTVSSRKEVFVSVTAVGEPLPGGPALRSGARPGDALVVTGMLGGSLLGRHLRPTPRFREMAALLGFVHDASLPPLSAAMDISDGLALDLSRMCRESGVGAVVEAAAVPASPEAFQTAESSGRTVLDHALSDGEDFELLLALPQETWEAFERFLAGAAEDGLARFSRIGRFTAEQGLFLHKQDGATTPLAAAGYEHLW